MDGKEKIKEDKEKSKGMIVPPYVAGTVRIRKKYKVNSTMKPHCTHCNIIVRLKDNVEDDKKTIPCMNCNSVYVRETETALNIRLKEHTKEVEKGMTQRFYTRSSRKESLTEYNKSTLTERTKRENHIID